MSYASAHCVIYFLMFHSINHVCSVGFSATNTLTSTDVHLAPLEGWIDEVCLPYAGSSISLYLLIFILFGLVAIALLTPTKTDACISAPPERSAVYQCTNLFILLFSIVFSLLGLVAVSLLTPGQGWYSASPEWWAMHLHNVAHISLYFIVLIIPVLLALALRTPGPALMCILAPPEGWTDEVCLLYAGSSISLCSLVFILIVLGALSPLTTGRGWYLHFGFSGMTT